ncbi:hypothetical protein ACWCWD_06565 [Streptomyces sp. NPDC001493]
MQTTTKPVIGTETARHVLWHFGYDGGMQPGTYASQLMRTIGAADRVHTEILRTVYPELVSAIELAQNDKHDIAKLQQIAAGLRCGRCGTADGPLAGGPEQSLCAPCRNSAKAAV